MSWGVKGFKLKWVAVNFASPTSKGSQLYKWRVKIVVYANIPATIYKAMTPTETFRAALKRDIAGKMGLPILKLCTDCVESEAMLRC